MDTEAAPAAPGRLQQVADSNIGKKAIMAVTGLILFGFVVGHMAGNLQVFLGAKKFNDYAHFLHDSPGLLWGTRAVLLGAILLHVGSATALTLRSQAARPIAYYRQDNVQASYAARTMMQSGVIVLAYVVYHLLHFTTGHAHGSFVEGDVYRNVVTGFQVVPVSGVYVVANVLLGMHLQHGIWSATHTLGFGDPRWVPAVKAFAAVTAGLITLGFISIPIAVLAGVVHT